MPLPHRRNAAGQSWDGEPLAWDCACAPGRAVTGRSQRVGLRAREGRHPESAIAVEGTAGGPTRADSAPDPCAVMREHRSALLVKKPSQTLHHTHTSGRVPFSVFPVVQTVRRGRA
ncbi:hypothetical protein GCM10022384_57460 [Streptomyces marokkonensis]|uniref:Uncharacterized protein n=1 Tax=Streptomyces marokkonensis TaxID=324855 RepID=A0ABP7RWR6_9ACTN